MTRKKNPWVIDVFWEAHWCSIELSLCTHGYSQGAYHWLIKHMLNCSFNNLIWLLCSDCISLEESIAAIRGATPQETLRLRKDRANQALSQAAIKTFSKECPGCGIRINRSEGCNKMKCTFCDTHFCYKYVHQLESISSFFVVAILLSETWHLCWYMHKDCSPAILKWKVD